MSMPDSITHDLRDNAGEFSPLSPSSPPFLPSLPQHTAIPSLSASPATSSHPSSQTKSPMYSSYSQAPPLTPSAFPDVVVPHQQAVSSHLSSSSLYHTPHHPAQSYHSYNYGLDPETQPPHRSSIPTHAASVTSRSPSSQRADSAPSSTPSSTHLSTASSLASPPPSFTVRTAQRPLMPRYPHAPPNAALSSTTPPLVATPDIRNTTFPEYPRISEKSTHFRNTAIVSPPPPQFSLKLSSPPAPVAAHALRRWCVGTRTMDMAIVFHLSNTVAYFPHPSGNYKIALSEENFPDCPLSHVEFVPLSLPYYQHYRKYHIQYRDHRRRQLLLAQRRSSGTGKHDDFQIPEYISEDADINWYDTLDHHAHTPTAFSRYGLPAPLLLLSSRIPHKGLSPHQLSLYCPLRRQQLSSHSLPSAVTKIEARGDYVLVAVHDMVCVFSIQFPEIEDFDNTSFVPDSNPSHFSENSSFPNTLAAHIAAHGLSVLPVPEIRERYRIRIAPSPPPSIFTSADPLHALFSANIPLPSGKGALATSLLSSGTQVFQSGVALAEKGAASLRSGMQTLYNEAQSLYSDAQTLCSDAVRPLGDSLRGSSASAWLGWEDAGEEYREEGDENAGDWDGARVSGEPGNGYGGSAGGTSRSNVSSGDGGVGAGAQNLLNAGIAATKHTLSTLSSLVGASSPSVPGLDLLRQCPGVYSGGAVVLSPYLGDVVCAPVAMSSTHIAYAAVSLPKGWTADGKNLEPATGSKNSSPSTSLSQRHSSRARPHSRSPRSSMSTALLSSSCPAPAVHYIDFALVHPPPSAPTLAKDTLVTAVGSLFPSPFALVPASMYGSSRYSPARDASSSSSSPPHDGVPGATQQAEGTVAGHGFDAITRGSGGGGVYEYLTQLLSHATTDTTATMSNGNTSSSTNVILEAGSNDQRLPIYSVDAPYRENNMDSEFPLSGDQLSGRDRTLLRQSLSALSQGTRSAATGLSHLGTGISYVGTGLYSTASATASVLASLQHSLYHGAPRLMDHSAESVKAVWDRISDAVVRVREARERTRALAAGVDAAAMGMGVGMGVGVGVREQNELLTGAAHAVASYLREEGTSLLDSVGRGRAFHTAAVWRDQDGNPESVNLSYSQFSEIPAFIGDNGMMDGLLSGNLACKSLGIFQIWEKYLNRYENPQKPLDFVCEGASDDEDDGFISLNVTNARHSRHYDASSDGEGYEYELENGYDGGDSAEDYEGASGGSHLIPGRRGNGYSSGGAGSGAGTHGASGGGSSNGGGVSTSALQRWFHGDAAHTPGVLIIRTIHDANIVLAARVAAEPILTMRFNNAGTHLFFATASGKKISGLNLFPSPPAVIPSIPVIAPSPRTFVSVEYILSRGVSNCPITHIDISACGRYVLAVSAAQTTHVFDLHSIGNGSGHAGGSREAYNGGSGDIDSDDDCDNSDSDTETETDVDIDASSPSSLSSAHTHPSSLSTPPSTSSSSFTSCSPSIRVLVRVAHALARTAVQVHHAYIQQQEQHQQQHMQQQLVSSTSSSLSSCTVNVYPLPTALWDILTTIRPRKHLHTSTAHSSASSSSSSSSSSPCSPPPQSPSTSSSSSSAAISPLLECTPSSPHPATPSYSLPRPTPASSLLRSHLLALLRAVDRRIYTLQAAAVAARVHSKDERASEGEGVKERLAQGEKGEVVNTCVEAVGDVGNVDDVGISDGESATDAPQCRPHTFSSSSSSSSTSLNLTLAQLTRLRAAILSLPPLLRLSPLEPLPAIIGTTIYPGILTGDVTVSQSENSQSRNCEKAGISDVEENSEKYRTVLLQGPGVTMVVPAFARIYGKNNDFARNVRERVMRVAQAVNICETVSSILCDDNNDKLSSSVDIELCTSTMAALTNTHTSSSPSTSASSLSSHVGNGSNSFASTRMHIHPDPTDSHASIGMRAGANMHDAGMSINMGMGILPDLPQHEVFADGNAPSLTVSAYFTSPPLPPLPRRVPLPPQYSSSSSSCSTHTGVVSSSHFDVPSHTLRVPSLSSFLAFTRRLTALLAIPSPLPPPAHSATRPTASSSGSTSTTALSLSTALMETTNAAVATLKSWHRAMNAHAQTHSQGHATRTLTGNTSTSRPYASASTNTSMHPAHSLPASSAASSSSASSMNGSGTRNVRGTRASPSRVWEHPLYPHIAHTLAHTSAASSASHAASSSSSSPPSSPASAPIRLADLLLALALLPIIPSVHLTPVHYTAITAIPHGSPHPAQTHASTHVTHRQANISATSAGVGVSADMDAVSSSPLLSSTNTTATATVTPTIADASLAATSMPAAPNAPALSSFLCQDYFAIPENHPEIPETQNPDIHVQPLFSFLLSPPSTSSSSSSPLPATIAGVAPYSATSLTTWRLTLDWYRPLPNRAFTGALRRMYLSPQHTGSDIGAGGSSDSTHSDGCEGTNASPLRNSHDLPEFDISGTGISRSALRASRLLFRHISYLHHSIRTNTRNNTHMKGDINTPTRADPRANASYAHAGGRNRIHGRIRYRYTSLAPASSSVSTSTSTSSTSVPTSAYASVPSAACPPLSLFSADGSIHHIVITHDGNLHNHAGKGTADALSSSLFGKKNGVIDVICSDTVSTYDGERRSSTDAGVMRGNTSGTGTGAGAGVGIGLSGRLNLSMNAQPQQHQRQGYGCAPSQGHGQSQTETRVHRQAQRLSQQRRQQRYRWQRVCACGVDGCNSDSILGIKVAEWDHFRNIGIFHNPELSDFQIWENGWKDSFLKGLFSQIRRIRTVSALQPHSHTHTHTTTGHTCANTSPQIHARVISNHNAPAASHLNNITCANTTNVISNTSPSFSSTSASTFAPSYVFDYHTHRDGHTNAHPDTYHCTHYSGSHDAAYTNAYNANHTYTHTTDATPAQHQAPQQPRLAYDAYEYGREHGLGHQNSPQLSQPCDKGNGGEYRGEAGYGHGQEPTYGYVSGVGESYTYSPGPSQAQSSSPPLSSSSASILSSPHPTSTSMLARTHPPSATTPSTAASVPADIIHASTRSLLPRLLAQVPSLLCTRVHKGVWLRRAPMQVHACASVQSALLRTYAEDARERVMEWTGVDEHVVLMNTRESGDINGNSRATTTASSPVPHQSSPVAHTTHTSTAPHPAPVSSTCSSMCVAEDGSVEARIGAVLRRLLCIAPEQYRATMGLLPSATTNTITNTTNVNMGNSHVTNSTSLTTGFSSHAGDVAQYMCPLHPVLALHMPLTLRWMLSPPMLYLPAPTLPLVHTHARARVHAHAYARAHEGAGSPSYSRSEHDGCDGVSRDRYMVEDGVQTYLTHIISCLPGKTSGISIFPMQNSRKLRPAVATASPGYISLPLPRPPAPLAPSPDEKTPTRNTITTTGVSGTAEASPIVMADTTNTRPQHLPQHLLTVTTPTPTSSAHTSASSIAAASASAAAVSAVSVLTALLHTPREAARTEEKVEADAKAKVTSQTSTSASFSSSTHDFATLPCNQWAAATWQASLQTLVIDVREYYSQRMRHSDKHAAKRADYGSTSCPSVASASSSCSSPSLSVKSYWLSDTLNSTPSSTLSKTDFTNMVTLDDNRVDKYSNISSDNAQHLLPSSALLTVPLPFSINDVTQTIYPHSTSSSSLSQSSQSPLDVLSSPHLLTAPPHTRLLALARARHHCREQVDALAARVERENPEKLPDHAKFPQGDRLPSDALVADHESKVSATTSPDNDLPGKTLTVRNSETSTISPSPSSTGDSSLAAPLSTFDVPDDEWLQHSLLAWATAPAIDAVEASASVNTCIGGGIGLGMGMSVNEGGQHQQQSQPAGHSSSSLLSAVLEDHFDDTYDNDHNEGAHAWTHARGDRRSVGANAVDGMSVGGSGTYSIGEANGGAYASAVMTLIGSAPSSEGLSPVRDSVPNAAGMLSYPSLVPLSTPSTSTASPHVSSSSPSAPIDVTSSSTSPATHSQPYPAATHSHVPVPVRARAPRVRACEEEVTVHVSDTVAERRLAAYREMLGRQTSTDDGVASGAGTAPGIGVLAAMGAGLTASLGMGMRGAAGEAVDNVDDVAEDGDGAVILLDSALQHSAIAAYFMPSSGSGDGDGGSGSGEVSNANNDDGSGAVASGDDRWGEDDHTAVLFANAGAVRGYSGDRDDYGMGTSTSMGMGVSGMLDGEGDEDWVTDNMDYDSGNPNSQECGKTEIPDENVTNASQNASSLAHLGDISEEFEDDDGTVVKVVL